eukprot:13567902-Heterocapsa_arctica.AAC.1
MPRKNNPLGAPPPSTPLDGSSRPSALLHPVRLAVTGSGQNSPLPWRSSCQAEWLPGCPAIQANEPARCPALVTVWPRG